MLYGPFSSSLRVAIAAWKQPLLGVSNMLNRRDQVPDKALIQKINTRLARAGLGSGCRVNLAVRNGNVTFSGTIQYDMQRRAVLTAARGVAGVRQVVDQLQIKQAEKKWTGGHPSGTSGMRDL